MKTLQSKVFTAALTNLRRELKLLAGTEKSFLDHYRDARLHAFEIEFLAKFLRKSQSANAEIFERLMLLSKDLEDRLGAFNETDELLSYCEKNEIHLPNGRPAQADLTIRRTEARQEFLSWAKPVGWLEPEGAASKTAEKLIAELSDLDDDDLRLAAIKKMAKFLSELQDNVDAGEFDPRKKRGYDMSEIENKVHELRREIRKIPMYAGYLRGLFALTDRPKLEKAAARTLKYFAPLQKTKLADSPFAKLPKAATKTPLLIPRPYFLAITAYISDLGNAKDWAHHLDSLARLGLPGQISFDQLDPALKDVFNRPESLNHLTTRVINEISSTQIFRHLANYIRAQA